MTSVRLLTPEAEASVRALDGTGGRFLVVIAADAGPVVSDVVGVAGWEPWWPILAPLPIIPDPVMVATESSIRSQVDAALATNQTIITGADTYLANANPTNAQVAAQARALTQAAKAAAQQRNKLIRLALGRFDGTD